MAWFPALLGPRNRMWIHFVSHKLARLLLPFALLAMAAARFWLPDPWRLAALAAQASGYGLALLDPVVPRWLPLKRVTSPARTLVVLIGGHVVRDGDSVCAGRAVVECGGRAELKGVYADSHGLTTDMRAF